MHQGIALIDQSLRQGLNTVRSALLSLRRMYVVGTAHLQHNLQLFSLGNYIWKRFLTNMGELLTSHFPYPNFFPMDFWGLGSGIGSGQPSKDGMKPVNEGLVRIGDLYAGSEIPSAGFGVFRMRSDVDASFSVNDACKVGILKFGGLAHVNLPVLGYSAVIQDCRLNVQPERLRRVDTHRVKRQSVLHEYMKVERGCRRAPPPCKWSVGNGSLGGNMLSNIDRLEHAPRPCFNNSIQVHKITPGCDEEAMDEHKCLISPRTTSDKKTSCASRLLSGCCFCQDPQPESNS